MLKIAFRKPLTALEIREPLCEVTEKIAQGYGLFAVFHQHQQAVFERDRERRKTKERIGNGKHKAWEIRFQPDAPHVNRPTNAGIMAVRSTVFPEQKQFGGFDYGLHNQPEPTYSYISLHTPTELGWYNPVDPNPDMLEHIYASLKAVYEKGQDSLFDVIPFVES